ncbi:MAG: hypothetical protein QCI38_04750, partial [Candidatus Thermoplasmatota archaeon]|nr:hypothetical protein [Candidatus Thermoplasmatota archaeon]
YTALGFGGIQYLVDNGAGANVAPNNVGIYTTCGDDTINSGWAGAGGTALNDIEFLFRVGGVEEDNYKSTVVYVLHY